jgi:hypothetical protein
MIGDSQLPASWQGSYGTLNTRQALAEIHARLLQLEASDIQPKREAAIMVSRRDGQIETEHVLVRYQKIHDLPESLEVMRKGRDRELIFVSPTIIGALLDALEADGNQTTGSPAGV